ncbi:MAG: DUF4330 domain-containing protein [Oscillospiraceae bacterium]|nr:DUF4330 domain-containing protein [Oscillospiraceae bacterium]
MKILDEKGKLFGKINVIDLVVLVVIVAIAAGLCWKLFGAKVSDALDSDSKVHMTYEVLCEDIDEQIAAYCASGDLGPLMSGGELVDGSVTGVAVTPYYESMVDANGTTVNYEVEGKKNITFTIECNTKLTKNAYPVGTQEVRVGKPHIVKTNKIEVTGAITAMEVEKANGAA